MALRARRENSPVELNDRTNPALTLEPVVSLAVLALFLQLAVIYFFNAVHKDGVGWKEGNAIYYFLQQDRIVTSLGIFLREHVSYETTRLFTYGTLAIEWRLPFIVLFPFLRTWTMRFALLLAIGLHGGIAVTSRLGPFSYAMLLMYMPVARLAGRRDPRALVFPRRSPPHRHLQRQLRHLSPLSRAS